MEEIEVKILNVDVQKVVRRLRRLGAQKVHDEEIDAIIYQSRRNPLKTTETLRLRRKGELVELCYKRALRQRGAKANEEIEVLVSDFDTAHRILCALGYQESKRIQKSRVSYKLDAVHYEFDTIPGIPTYLEIEAHSMQELEEYVRKIGYQMSDTVTWSQTKVIEHYRK